MEQHSRKMTFRFPEQADDSYTRERNPLEVGKPLAHKQLILEQEEAGSVQWSEWQYVDIQEGLDKRVVEQAQLHNENPSLSERKLDQTALSQTEFVSAAVLFPADAGNERDESEAERVERSIRELEASPGAVFLEPPIYDPAAQSATTEGEWRYEPQAGSDGLVYTQARKVKPSLLKIAGSVVGAVATGALFGFLALSLFKGDVTLPSVDQAVPAVATLGKDSGANNGGHTTGTLPIIGDTGDQTNGQSSSEGQASVPVVAIQIPASISYVLQYGVFSQLEGAQAAANELRKLGLAAVDAEGEGQHRVYAAIAEKKEDAMILSNALKEKQLDLYVRTIERPEITKVAFEGTAATLESFTKQGDAVRQWLIRHSTATLQAGNFAAFNQTSMDELRTDHLRWTQSGEKLQKELTKQTSEVWVKLVQTMNTAITAVNEYNKKPAAAHLWNIQQSCIQYMMLEQDWLKQMKA
ncbi:SPOR domain-containing protein [Paenibacillus taiwanensis]|uniref:SPOR domain-containing protein n=1 Tax=Paenibacillus taiwanensis TaxID=401638 RepID=UPI0003F646E6|nr:SPOR domain-containing protein [Paenibacillus taiwanensis]